MATSGAVGHRVELVALGRKLRRAFSVAGIGAFTAAALLDLLDCMLCTDCQSGYHAPYDRFERLATNPDVPSFLMRCRQCTALWNESSGVPELLTRTHARWLYPAARI